MVGNKCLDGHRHLPLGRIECSLPMGLVSEKQKESEKQKRKILAVSFARLRWCIRVFQYQRGIRGATAALLGQLDIAFLRLMSSW